MIKRWLVMVLFSATIMIFSIIGVYDAFWSVPDKKTQIHNLVIEKQAWADRAIAAEAKIEDYQIALNFEKLFLLLAKPDTITLLGDLEKQIEEKAEFYLKDFREVEND